ncbi:DNA replication and repair protein RecF [Flammeovirgaceae bacterium SG7u.111]|nr:DNA replication and repair protein RecF [Flammeovirgaceae bacterium SG7u.132]WPO35191.1 DNA replication and repair protein RecF [Flammeovirgaceae bacterium SG7u.111]
MFLEEIYLYNFKNYEELKLSFSKDINCVVGPNGVGKTNLLDAIHYLCLTKSAFQSVEQLNIKHEEYLFVVRGNFIKQENKTEVQCSFQQGKKKVVKVDRKEHEKISEHIGRYPCVMISPDDIDLVREGSEFRRRYFDSMISQLDQVYMQNLMRYNHTLRQRNALLKQFSETQRVDLDLLEPYDQLLLEMGKLIFERRKLFLEEFTSCFQEFYKDISESHEEVGLVYQSDWGKGDFEAVFKKALDRDVFLQRTSKGIHKDDFVFEIGEGYSLKKFGSQGQKKSFVIALKLSQFEVSREAHKDPPILLLDDIFDKLDDLRISKILSMIEAHRFGQIFISDARPERSAQLLASLEKEVEFYRVEEFK